MSRYFIGTPNLIPHFPSAVGFDFHMHLLGGKKDLRYYLPLSPLRTYFDGSPLLFIFSIRPNPWKCSDPSRSPPISWGRNSALEFPTSSDGYYRSEPDQFATSISFSRPILSF